VYLPTSSAFTVIWAVSSIEKFGVFPSPQKSNRKMYESVNEPSVELRETTGATYHGTGVARETINLQRGHAEHAGRKRWND